MTTTSTKGIGCSRISSLLMMEKNPGTQSHNFLHRPRRSDIESPYGLQLLKAHMACSKQFTLRQAFTSHTEWFHQVWEKLLSAIIYDSDVLNGVNDVLCTC